MENWIHSGQVNFRVSLPCSAMNLWLNDICHTGFYYTYCHTWFHDFGLLVDPAWLRLAFPNPLVFGYLRMYKGHTQLRYMLSKLHTHKFRVYAGHFCRSGGQLMLSRVANTDLSVLFLSSALGHPSLPGAGQIQHKKHIPHLYKEF